MKNIMELVSNYSDEELVNYSNSTDITLLKNRIEELIEENQELKEENEANSSKIDELEEKVFSLKDKKETIEKQLESYKDFIYDLLKFIKENNKVNLLRAIEMIAEKNNIEIE